MGDAQIAEGIWERRRLRMVESALKWVVGLVLLISVALFINLSGAMFALMNHYSPHMAMGRVTFPQLLYTAWVSYYKDHRYRWIVMDDLPGLALIATTVLAVGYFKWREHNWLAAGTDHAASGPIQGSESVWPPAPKR